jgi:formylglycine-generating enzyme required for sulfatase activity
MNMRYFGIVAAVAACLTVAGTAGTANADSFGTGANQFTMDFVSISGATNPGSGYGIVNHDYSIGKYEVTNDQWNKFSISLGVPVTGVPSNGYDGVIQFTGLNMPNNRTSLYEAAQFVNWLNTSTGYRAAYNFTGTQGTNNYALATGSPGVYRNPDAKYFLPTEDEWVKAAYWNGTSLQTYATIGNGSPNTTGWNYNSSRASPWNVGSGTQELNGTYDMMGNVAEWTETFQAGSTTVRYMDRGGAYTGTPIGTLPYLASSGLHYVVPETETGSLGFRVASNPDAPPVPEPVTMAGLMLGIGGLVTYIRKRRTA